MYRAGCWTEGCCASGWPWCRAPAPRTRSWLRWIWRGACCTRRAQAPSRLALPPWRPSGEASRSCRASGCCSRRSRGHAAGTAAVAYTRQDPFKAVIYDRTGSLSGYALQRALEARGCVPEMSDEQRVVLLFTLASTREDANHVLWALVHIVEQGRRQKGSEPNQALRQRARNY